MSAWEAVEEAIATRDPAKAAEIVLGLDDQGRKEVAARLPGHLPVARRLQRTDRGDGTWQSDDDWIAPMRVAGAGTIGGAAAVVAWLNRREFADRWARPDELESLRRVVAIRPPEWQADLAVRAARRLKSLRPNTEQGGRLALLLLCQSGAVPPAHDPLVVAWVGEWPGRLREDPLRDHLLPLIFEAEGVGRALQGEQAAPLQPGTWLESLAVLQSEGTIDRGLLIDGCLRRFLRGGSAGDLRFFVRLHELVEPTYTEVASRARDYLRLLPAAPGVVAELALRHLRRFDALDPADVAEALQALLFRPERKLVSVGLTWLDQAARDADDNADEYALALAYAFACESPDIQVRAARLALKHGARFTLAGAEVIRDALGLLPPDLGEQLVTVFGGEVAADEDDDFVPVPLPESPSLDAGFPLIEDIRELGVFPDREDWQGAERWLAAFVRFCADDRDLLRSVLARGTSWPTRLDVQPEWRYLDQWSEAMARQIVTPEIRFGPPPSLSSSVPSPSPSSSRLPSLSSRLPLPARVSPQHLFLLRRWAEVHAALRAGTLPPYLLATPTSGTWHLDPGVLVDRLEGYERTGAKAMDTDLWQALLRLPRSIAPEVAARAGGLTSGAGGTAARWMSDRPSPVTAVGWTRDITPYAGDREPSGGEHPDLVPRIDLRHGESGLPLDLSSGGAGPLRDLFSDPDRHRWDGHSVYMPWWPAVLPSDREVVALHCLPFLLYQWNALGVESGILRALVRADGVAGEGVALLLAYFLVERDSRLGGTQPNAGVRALVGMAERGDLPAAEVGRQLALLLRRAWFKLGAVVESLESAARHGAHVEVWEVVAGFLAVYLPGPGESPRTAHTQALGFAVRVAAWAGARGELPCVAEIARRKGSSGFVREARRLHARLS
ncbi:DUF6493 family protein [Nonomuraea sp. NPDC049269]|uniref:DUF6493 family protein n=1 Tax=Nonomuraea sp. NPDC049269 TaxID=3364349 RepID=UPI00372190C5